MPRFGRPDGRFFGTRDELRRIDRGVELHQQVYGLEVEWFFLEHVDEVSHDGPETQVHDLYDEGDVDNSSGTGGKRFHGPLRVPVMSAVAVQGPEQGGDQGFQTQDRVVLRLGYEQARRAGLELDMVANREEHLHDRFVFRRRVFDVESIQSSGHFDSSARDTTIRIEARQLRQDELYDSPDFQSYVLPSGAPQSGTTPPPPPPADARPRVFYGDGPPVSTAGFLTDDQYVDQLTGDVYTYGG